jgi:hypothetical protein
METGKKVTCYKALLDEFCALARLRGEVMTEDEIGKENELDALLFKEMGTWARDLWNRAYTKRRDEEAKGGAFCP